MLTKNAAYSNSESSLFELTQVLNLLKAVVPELIENRKIDELYTLLTISFSMYECHIEELETALKVLKPSSVHKLT